MPPSPLPDPSDEGIRRAAAARAAAVRDALRRDDESLAAADPSWHDGREHYARATAAAECLLAELTAAAGDATPESETPRP